MTKYLDKDPVDLEAYLELKDSERDEIEEDTLKLIMELEIRKGASKASKFDLIDSYAILGGLALFLVIVTITIIQLR